MADRLTARVGHSEQQDAARAVEELASAIEQPDASIAYVFASPRFDLDQLSSALRERLSCPVVGCTTAGELTPAGYSQGTLCGFSLKSAELLVASHVLSPLSQLDRERVEAVTAAITDDLARAREHAPGALAFAVLLVDGMSVMEEQVAALLGNVLGGVPLIGGSAGDDLAFERTAIYTGTRFVSDAAVLTLFVTTLPFTPIKTQHFSATDQRVVITEASPEQRVVREIDGLPAAQAYAELIGVPVEQLGPTVFSTHPLLLLMGGEPYVRSIQKVNEDGSLTFFCAIDEGVVLRLARAQDMVTNLDSALSAAHARVPSLKLTLGCDCILRRLEVEDKGLQAQIGEVWRRHHVIGFNTYGEQFDALHVNQTFTGIALGG